MILLRINKLFVAIGFFNLLELYQKASLGREKSAMVKVTDSMANAPAPHFSHGARSPEKMHQCSSHLRETLTMLVN